MVQVEHKEGSVLENRPVFRVLGLGFSPVPCVP